ncbi:sugar nucleotide-binding protein [Formosa sediminum]|uniref:dTDP-4-dehydrorhamnose reductase n=1 Tax=Formosa sediminum TaxID=2594004 RepID=A0A516GU61_9FLAO|nr:sugar nucleotide-binding protein [Formosa sediminum]QDO95066.1 sugar nucleotide-binding protein [Formosa sediminum]
MKEHRSKHRVLILGASGFIGHAIYKELCSYFNTYGTFNTARREFENNHHFFQYNVEEDDVFEILTAIRPTIIISALRGDFSAQVIAHSHLSEYILTTNAKLFFISSANVFDAYSQFPSYELDKTLSHSVYGHFKIKIENMLMRLPKQQVVILRLPMVFGTQSPRIKEIKQHLHEKTPIEVFPNLIINVTTDSKITQQIHYLINRNKYGIYHLGSTDLVHHNEFIAEIVSSIGLYNPIFKQVYTTNNDRYLAVLPKENLLPKHLHVLSKQILTELEV